MSDQEVKKDSETGSASSVTQEPEPTSEPSHKDALTKEAKLLQQQLVQGMPTNTEMTQGLPGAIRKQLAWEKQHKRNIVRYKRIREMVSGIESIEELRLP